MPGYCQHSRAAVGVDLSEHVGAVLEALAALHPNDSAIPPARERWHAEPDEHTTTLIGNHARSRVIVEREIGPAPECSRSTGYAALALT